MIKIKIASALLFAVVIIAAFFWLGYNRREKNALARERMVVDWNGSAKQTKDALARWAKKNGESLGKVMTGRYPRVLSFPDRNCIELELDWGWVGGEPIYCYRPNSLVLVEEHSDVE
jgi:hypothetical protein